MRRRRLGRTPLEVSPICLGTMTFGEQNTTAEAFEQLDYALAHGIDFIDTAEMYPVPPRAATYTRTEEIIGEWIAARGNRHRFVLATKVLGRSRHMDWARGGPRLTPDQIRTACEESLRRLRTDHIDLYQVHWPERKTNFFGRRDYVHVSNDDPVPVAETLGALAELVREGKVRHVGISNETPWGVAAYLRAAEQEGLPRVVSIQNPYNLLNRTFEIGLAEMAHREDVGLLAYSPLAFGVLSGKYLEDRARGEARLSRWPEHFDRYSGRNARRATERYLALAREAGLDPAQMALAWVTSRPFTTANIIGATTMAQLADNIASAQIELHADVLEAIEKIHREIPDPAP